MVGSRPAGWLGVIVGIGTLAVFFWRLNVAVIDLRDGFPTAVTVEQIENQPVTSAGTSGTTTTPCSPIAGGCTSQAAA